MSFHIEWAKSKNVRSKRVNNLILLRNEVLFGRVHAPWMQCNCKQCKCNAESNKKAGEEESEGWVSWVGGGGVLYFCVCINFFTVPGWIQSDSDIYLIWEEEHSLSLSLCVWLSLSWMNVSFTQSITNNIEVSFRFVQGSAVSVSTVDVPWKAQPTRI